MNREQARLFWIALLLIGGTALGVSQLKSHQKLGEPGIQTRTIPGDVRREIILPRRVLDYECLKMGTDSNLTSGLPADTSLNLAYYFPRDEDPNRNPLDFVQINLVLMGSDRTSIHKPEFCLTSQGWVIDPTRSGPETIHMEKPFPYDLNVWKMSMSTTRALANGPEKKYSGFYVFWFIADNDLTADHTSTMRNSALHLLKTGELERWAYVGFFAVCLPGEEEKTYKRLKDFIVATTPEFQRATPQSTPSR